MAIDPAPAGQSAVYCYHPAAGMSAARAFVTLGRGERAAAQLVTVHLEPPGAGDIGIALDQGFPLTVTSVRDGGPAAAAGIRAGAAIAITVRRGAETRTLRVIVGHSPAQPWREAAARRRRRYTGCTPHDTMQDNHIESTPERAPGSPRLGKLMTFARQHPVLSVVGAAGVGRVGGPEVALGVVLGVGLAVLIDRSAGREPARAGGATAEARAGDAAEGAHHVRRRAREILDGAPGIVKQRARAVVQAVRGKLAPVPEPEPPPGHGAVAQDAGSVPSTAV